MYLLKAIILKNKYMKQRYGKLVRDLVPQKLRLDGFVVNEREMDNDEYKRELLYLLIEEAENLRKAGYDPNNKEELQSKMADIFELIETIVKEFNLSKDEIENLQAKKRAEEGGFEKKIFLESTIK